MEPNLQRTRGNRLKDRFSSAVSILIAATTVGCGGGPVRPEPGESTRLSGTDVVAAADAIAPSLMNSAEVAAEAEAGRVVRVVVLPVTNRLTGQVMTGAERHLFTGELQARLSQAAPDDFEFVAPSERIYAMRAGELGDAEAVALAAEDIDPDYALHAIFRSLRNESAGGLRDDYVAEFSLLDLRDKRVAWSDTYRTTRERRKDYGDR